MAKTEPYLTGKCCQKQWPDAAVQVNEEGSPSSPLASRTSRSGESGTLACRQLLSRRDASAQSGHQHTCTWARAGGAGKPRSALALAKHATTASKSGLGLSLSGHRVYETHRKGNMLLLLATLPCLSVTPCHRLWEWLSNSIGQPPGSV